MSTRARTSRRWPLVVAVVAATAVLGAGVVAVTVLVAGGEPTAATSTTSDDAATAVPSTPPESGVPGCQAGSAITNAALLQAQHTSGMDEAGAAAFSADLFRWLGSDPTAEQADELADTIEQVLAPSAQGSLRDTFTAAVDQARQGLSVDDWYVSTEGARFYVESSTSQGTVVSIAATRVFDDGSRQSGTQTFTLVAAEPGWQLQELSQMRTTADLQQLGTSYTGGC